MIKVKRGQFLKLYDIYKTCKTHKGKPYCFNKFLILCKQYDSIIEICERERLSASRKKEPLTDEEYKKVDDLHKNGYKVSTISESTGINKQKIYKYYINHNKNMNNKEYKKFLMDKEKPTLLSVNRKGLDNICKKHGVLLDDVILKEGNFGKLKACRAECYLYLRKVGYYYGTIANMFNMSGHSHVITAIKRHFPEEYQKLKK